MLTITQLILENHLQDIAVDLVDLLASTRMKLSMRCFWAKIRYDSPQIEAFSLLEDMEF